MAGHETTANTLAWAWFLLVGHPEVEARLHAELDQVLDGRPPTVADLPRLPYTESVDQRDAAGLSDRLDGRPRGDRAGRARRLPDPDGHDGLHAPVGHPPRRPLVRRSRRLSPRALGRGA